MSDYFPPNVLIKILLELPVKSLVRFTLVSKTWQAFITSEDFIATHLSRVQYDPTYKNRSRDSLIIRYYSELDATEHYELRPNDSCFLSESSEINFRLKSRVGFNQIVGSCNGIICLCDDVCGNFSTCPIVLWNPSIQKDIVLPLPLIEPITKCFVLGFGYDVMRDDYKVVRILYRQGFIRKPVWGEVFSLRSKRWKTAKDLALKGYINDIGQSQVYFNGIVHWMAYQEKGNNGNLQNSILGFDCSDEEFIETLLPDVLANLGLSPNLHIAAHQGCLGLISYNASFCRIWEMKEYGSAESWTQLYFFEWTQLYEVPLRRRVAKVVGFTNTGELLVTLMLENDANVSSGRSFHIASGELISYNPKTREVSKIPQVRGWIDSFHVLDYEETLCLLDYSFIYPKKAVLDNYACFQETYYPFKEELVSYEGLIGESDKCDFKGEDSEEVHGFGKFKGDMNENNDGDVCMGEVNLDNEAGDDIVSMKEFDDSGKFKNNEDVNDGGDACMGEVNVDNDAEYDIVSMEDDDDSWIILPDLKDLQIDPANKPRTD